MKRRVLNTCLAAFAAIPLLSSCSSTPQSRIAKHPDMYAALSGSQREAVQTGRLLEGMSKDAVYLAWGRPAGVKEGSSKGQRVEKWRYVGHRPVVTNHFSFGYGYGGYHHGHCRGGYYEYGPSIEYVPYTNAVVEFRNGRVASWERERR